MPAHPLDPLSPDELAAAIEIVRRERELTRDHLFVFTLLAEPSKAELDAWREGDPIDRAARITIWDRAEEALHRVAAPRADRRQDRQRPAPAAHHSSACTWPGARTRL